ncbi:hypothetical protein FACS1894140_6730 [Spirochaetia bacterium]|nr:hypothetical protein FACS1894140_6730 [Spirochaetia bacterium]
MYRFHPHRILAAEIVRTGEIGKLMTTGGAFSFTNKDASNIRNIAAMGGGAMLDIGCYSVSSSRFLMAAEPRRVVCTIIRDPQFKTDVFASAILDYGEGRTSTFTVSTQMFPYQQITAIGTGGSLSVEVPYNMYGDIPGHVRVTVGNGSRLIETEIADQYLLEFDAFAEALIDKAPMPTPISDAVANMAVIDALFASAESGKWENVVKY